jgi:endogenous inhibitor of DNA gyrase (YacG/DUF329 family)
VTKLPEFVRCPACRRLARFAGNPNRPFCSERCKLHDLGNWAAERYRIAGDEPLPATEDPRSKDEEEE